MDRLINPVDLLPQLFQALVLGRHGINYIGPPGKRRHIVRGRYKIKENLTKESVDPSQRAYYQPAQMRRQPFRALPGQLSGGLIHTPGAYLSWSVS